MDNGPPAGNRFVGRQREMAELNPMLEDALAGQGRVVMLAGEPGIGKTRTAQELASHAATLGAQVLWGWCYEQEGAPPYWPWVQPIRSYVERATAEALRSEMGPGAADIAELISEVRTKLPDLEPLSPLEPEQARFRLFDSTTAFLKKAAQSRPVLLVLDDLHWADKPSLLLLQFLARQLGGCPMLVVGTYRDVEVSRQHPLSETLAQLSRLPEFMRLELKGLDREDTADFIQNATGVRSSPQVAEAVYSHTEGNPFFMSQVVRLLSERAELASAEVSSPEDIGIPSGVREAIGQRLNRLSARCNETLSLASAIGRGFDFRLLRVLSPQVTEDQLLEAIDEALGGHLIEGLPGGEERYQFSHALVQQTLTEALSASRRVRLHARVGEALEALYGADVEANAAELAYHFGQAAPLLGRDKLVHYSLLAGERALAAYAWEEAQAHFQRGLAAKEGLPMDAGTAALSFGLGRAQAATLERQQMQGAVDNLCRAFDYYAQAGDVARAVAVAEHPVTIQPGINTGMALLTARALTLVPPDSHEAGHLLAHHGGLMGLEEGDYEAAQEAFGRALAIAQREQDTLLEMWALTYSCKVDFFHIRLEAGVRKGLRAIELARLADSPRAELEASQFTANALRTMGDLDAARLLASAVLAPGKKLRDSFLLPGTLWLNGEICRLKGDWETARSFSDHGLAVSPTDTRLLTGRVLLEYETGDFGQGEAHLERLLEATRLNPRGPSVANSFLASVIPSVGRIAGVVGRQDVAETAADTVLSSPLAAPMVTVSARKGPAMLAVLQGDADRARAQYAALESNSGLMLPSSGISQDRLLGLLAQTMGDLGRAAQHFEEALAFCRKAGYRPELAWTCHDYAESLLVGARQAVPLQPAPAAGDRTKALSLLEEALAISTELGMRPLMARVSALRDRVASGPEAAPAYPDGLTQREVEVLRLVALGKINREIAEELFISLNTVLRHVSNIFSKTGVANRAGLATYAARHGLASP